MGLFTGIEWTNATFNPWSGCHKVSPACANCYAANLPPGMRRGAEWGLATDRIAASDAYWKQPVNWNKAASTAGKRLRVFCASTADVFEDRPDLDAHRLRLWSLIHATPWLDWLLLTKRPAVMAAWSVKHGWPVNAWAGTTVEDQQRANERIPSLLRVPAPVRFLSMEPMLGPVNLENIDIDPDWRLNALSGIVWRKDESAWADYDGRIGWVICGGESGPRARPMAARWARDICDACALHDVPFFFKQWGEFIPEDQIRNLPPEVQGYACTQIREIDGEGVRAWRYGKSNTGRLLDGQEWSQIPEVKP